MFCINFYLTNTVASRCVDTRLIAFLLPINHKFIETLESITAVDNVIYARYRMRFAYFSVFYVHEYRMYRVHKHLRSNGNKDIDVIRVFRYEPALVPNRRCFLSSLQLHVNIRRSSTEPSITRIKQISETSMFILAFYS